MWEPETKRVNAEEQLHMAIWQHIKFASPEYRDDLARAFSNVSFVTDTGCWVWTVGNNWSYPRFWWGSPRRISPAHRFVLIALGNDMTGLVGRHSCDNKRCVNPAHLLPGSYQDNLNDAMERGRHKNPPPMDWPARMMKERHHWQKLSREDVVAIRARLACGESQNPIASDYGVSSKTISKIKLRQRWAHVS